MAFLWSKLIQSVLKKVAVLVVSVVTGAKVAPVLTSLGITVDPTVMIAGVFGLLEAGRVWVTHQAWTPELAKKVL